MLKGLTILFFILPCLSLYGQSADSLQQGIKITLDGPQINFNEPLFFVSLRGKQVEIQKDSLWINPDWIFSINVFKAQNAVSRYGTRGQYGAVLIELKKENLDKLPEDLKRKFTSDN